MITLTNLKTKETLKYKNRDMRFCYITDNGKLFSYGFHVTTTHYSKAMSVILSLSKLCTKPLHLKRYKKDKPLDMFCVIYHHKTNKRIFYLHKKTNLEIFKYVK